MIRAELTQAETLFEHLQVQNRQPRHVGRLVSHDAGMLEVTGFRRPIGSGARVLASDGSVCRAEVVGFRGERTLLVPLDADAPLENGIRVEPDSQANMVQVGEGLIGRVIDAMGQPLDRKGPIIAGGVWPLNGVKGNVLDRGRVTEPFDLGVRAVNALLTAGRGQRIAIIAGSGVGKSVLMGQMIAGAEADIVVTGLIGERGREVSDFLETKLKHAMHKSIVVAVPADHPPVLRLRAAARATAIAEYFRARGKKVLLLIDSLTRCAHAQREIGLALGEPPAPGSARAAGGLRLGLRRQPRLRAGRSGRARPIRPPRPSDAQPTQRRAGPVRQPAMRPQRSAAPVLRPAGPAWRAGSEIRRCPAEPALRLLRASRPAHRPRSPLPPEELARPYSWQAQPTATRHRHRSAERRSRPHPRPRPKHRPPSRRPAASRKRAAI
jgi:hypothetical protein